MSHVKKSPRTNIPDVAQAEALYVAPGRRRKGFGYAVLVFNAGMFGSVAATIPLLIYLQKWGGPDLLDRRLAGTALLRLLVLAPAPLTFMILFGRMPRTHRSVTGWMLAMAITMAIELPGLFPEHTGGGAFIGTTLIANCVGIAIANTKRFRDVFTSV